MARRGKGRRCVGRGRGRARRWAPGAEGRARGGAAAELTGRPRGKPCGGGTWPRREARGSPPEPGSPLERGRPSRSRAPSPVRPPSRGHASLTSSWAGICSQALFMEAMSPQQETLGGQPGRSSSLTGVSRIAGGPGTKKVRTPSGTPPPPARALRRCAGRTPRVFNARGSRPAASVRGHACLPVSPGHPGTPGLVVSRVSVALLVSRAAALSVLIRRPPPSGGARGPLLRHRPPQPRRVPGPGVPRGPSGAHRHLTGSAPRSPGPRRSALARRPRVGKVGGRRAAPVGLSAPHLDAAPRPLRGVLQGEGRPGGVLAGGGTRPGMTPGHCKAVVSLCSCAGDANG